MINDKELAEAENLLREMDYPYPIAWAFGFILDHRELIYNLLDSNGRGKLAIEFEKIVNEIETGEVA